MIALKNEGLWDKVQQELVYAQSIAQAFQFASSGAADAGFCAYSSMFTPTGKKGKFKVVKEAPPVIQAACILKSSKNKDAARKFIEFLSGPEAKSIKKKYGYD